MTDHDKLIENYEDALFALMMDEMAQSEGARLAAENEALQADAAAAVPPEVHKRCLNTIRGGLLRRSSIATLRAAGRLLGHLAAAVFITVALFTAAFAASPVFRSGTLNLLMDIDAELVQWSFEGRDEANSTASSSVSEVPDLAVTWLPDGYDLVSETHDLFNATFRYENSAGDKLSVSLLAGGQSATLKTDKEHADFWEEITIHGAAGIAIKKNNTSSVSWLDADTNTFVDVYSDSLSLDQLRSVAEGISLVP